ncbi:MAG: discoidin domain-containing protein [Deltaproteobacteria bacterium]|nr:discoidin domain-containing protein [Deltaproteobacteria bacterium]
MRASRLILLISVSLLFAACNRERTHETRITASSVHESYGPEGLLKAAEPGWHAQRAPIYPQTVTISLAGIQQFAQVEFLPQLGQLGRAPKKVLVEISDDANAWKEVASVENDCSAPSENWRAHSLGRTVSAAHVRIKILSNCGDLDLLTLRGIRFK